MKYLSAILIIVLCLPGISSGQKEIFFYDAAFGKINQEEDAVYKRVVKKQGSKKYRVDTYKFTEDEWDKVKWEVMHIRKNNRIQIRMSGEKFLPKVIYRSFREKPSGGYYFTDIDRNDTIREGSCSSLFPLHLQDTLYTYYSYHRKRSVAIYNNNKLISNKNWLKKGQPYIEDIHQFVSTEPLYSGGQAEFSNHMMGAIKESGIDLSQLADNVIIGYVITAEGKSTGFTVVQGVFTPLNEVLISGMKSLPGEWTPAKVNGRAVNYYMTLPFNFIERRSTFHNLEMSGGVMHWQ